MPDHAIAPAGKATGPPTPSASEPAAFRAEFPVFERLSYLNAGTEGPVPRRASDAAHRRLDLETARGRCGQEYFAELMALRDRLRDAYAGLLGCAPSELALTGSTTDGVNTVIAGLDLRPGDEILTTDEEHPGLLAPLGRARRRYGISVRMVPFDEIAGQVSPKTRLIACSHVSWVRGRLVDTAALAQTGVPVLLDAAQAIGAIRVDVRALGCDFYAASGQKWLCGPEGSGCLYVRKERLEELLIPWPGYGSLADPEQALELAPAEGAARLDLGFPTGIRSAWCLAAFEVFANAGWGWVHDRAAELAATLAHRLTELGLEVLPRGRSTLVSWKAADAKGEVGRFAADRFVVRSIPAFDVVRASVGAWSSEDELEALARLAAGGRS
ncbi:MAG: aminotransferase class V-fold PLP-dependent enzyme [Solirubrobacterales bacterium]|nr:aminotransferase class V-fold PLP-dependent enzyme [Solirubrobacterales bacterium]